MDSNLKFKKHFLIFFSAIATKLSALATIVKLVLFIVSQIQFKSCFESQINTLVWIIYSHITNNKVNRVHERVFRLVCGYYQEMF